MSMIKSEEVTFHWFFKSCEQMSYLNIADLFDDARFKLKHKRRIYRFHKQINGSRLLKLVPHRKSASNAHWFYLKIRRTVM